MAKDNDFGAGNKIYAVKISVRWDSTDKSLENEIVESLIAQDDLDLEDQIVGFLEAYSDDPWISYDYEILSVRD